jgi:hypothetical protein
MSPNSKSSLTLRYTISGVLLLIVLFVAWTITNFAIQWIYTGVQLDEATRAMAEIFKMTGSDQLVGSAFNASVALTLLFFFSWVPVLVGSYLKDREVEQRKWTIMLVGGFCGFVVSELLLVALSALGSEGQLNAFSRRTYYVLIGAFFASVIFEYNRGGFNRSLLKRIATYSIANSFLLLIVDASIKLFPGAFDAILSFGEILLKTFLFLTLATIAVMRSKMTTALEVNLKNNPNRMSSGGGTNASAADPLPEDFICPHCKSKMRLDDVERRKRVFTCPSCHKDIDMR